MAYPQLLPQAKDAVSKTDIQLDKKEYGNEEFYDHVFGLNESKKQLKQKFTNKNKEVRRVSNTDTTIDEFIKMAKADACTQLFVDAGALIQGKSNRAVAEKLAETTKWVVYYDTKREALHAIQKSGNGFEEKHMKSWSRSVIQITTSKKTSLGFLTRSEKQAQI